jgi:hypothetical protein
MFYLLKHLLHLILVIYKLKCNNLIFNEIMVFNALYVCLLHSRFIENHPIWILEDGPIISEWFCYSWYQSQIGAKHTLKHLKITTTLCWWGSLSPYKEYNSLLRWQANLFGIASTKVCGDLDVLVFFLVYEIIWLFLVLVELLGILYDSCLFMKVWLFVLSL